MSLLRKLGIEIYTPPSDSSTVRSRTPVSLKKKILFYTVVVGSALLLIGLWFVSLTSPYVNVTPTEISSSPPSSSVQETSLNNVFQDIGDILKQGQLNLD